MTAAFWCAYAVIFGSIAVAAWRQQPSVGQLIRALQQHAYTCEECAPRAGRPASPCREARRLSERITNAMVARDSRRRFG